MKSFATIWNSIRVLLLGSGVTQLVVVVGTILIGLLFEPQEFGRFVVISTIALTIGALAALRYERAIVVARRNRTARSVALVGYAALLVTTALAAIALTLVIQFELLELKWTDVCAIGTTVLCFGAYQIRSQWMIRQGEYRRLAVSEFVGPGIAVILQVSFGALGWLTADALLAGFVIARVFQFAAVIETGVRSVRFSFRRLANVAFAFRAFPLVTLPYSLVSVSLTRGLLLISALFLSAHSVGLLAMAHRLSFLPATTIANAVRRVVVKRLAVNIDSAQSKDEIYVVFRIAVATLAPMIFVTVFIVPIVFILFAGDKWIGFEKFVYLLSPAASILLVTSWMDRIYEIRRKQRLSFYLECASTVIILLAFYGLLSLEINAYIAVGVFSMLAFSYNLVWLYVTLDVAKFPKRGYFENLFRYLGLLLSIVLCFVLAERWDLLSNEMYLIGLGTAIAVLVIIEARSLTKLYRSYQV